MASGRAKSASQTAEARKAVVHHDGSCIRLRSEHRNQVWAYDFVFDRTREGRPLKLLNVIDEFTHECLTIEGPVSATAS